MWLHVSCSLEFELAEATSFIFMLRPRSGSQQWVAREQYIFLPSVPAAEFTDGFGNLCQRLEAPAGAFAVHTAADIQAEDACDEAPGAAFVPVGQLPENTLPFLLPSRYCEADRFTDMAWSLAAEYTPGYDQCRAIVDYIRRTMAYTPGAGAYNMSACEINGASAAVCRDMAHLGIALCRALSIPARMVVGYFEGLEPMDLHAWFEAYVGGRWFTFDPTRAHLEGGRVALAYGRDAADVAVYTQFGAPAPLVGMHVNLEHRPAPAAVLHP